MTKNERLNYIDLDYYNKVLKHQFLFKIFLLYIKDSG